MCVVLGKRREEKFLYVFHFPRGGKRRKIGGGGVVSAVVVKPLVSNLQ